jgi:hypothetical protein
MTESQIKLFLRAKARRPELWAQAIAIVLLTVGCALLFLGLRDASLLINLGVGVGLGSALTDGAFRSVSRRQLIEVIESQVSRDPALLREIARIRGGAEQSVQPDRRDDAAPG